MTRAIFLPEASLPALDGGVDRLYTQSFFFLVGLSLSLTDSGAILVPPGSTTEAGWRCTRVDHMVSQYSVQYPLLASDATWGAIRVTFQNASQAKTAGGNIHHLSACARP